VSDHLNTRKYVAIIGPDIQTVITVNEQRLNVLFYSAPQSSHCKRCTSYSNSVCLSLCLSVCLSVRPSHAGIVSKRRHV